MDLELQVVLLQSGDPPGPVLSRVLQHPYYSERVQWVTGSAFEEAHLKHWVAGGAFLDGRRSRLLLDERREDGSA